MNRYFLISILAYSMASGALLAADDKNPTVTSLPSDGYAITPLPDPPMANLPARIKLQAPADLTKEKHLEFARSVRMSPDGDNDFIGLGLTETMFSKSSLTKEQAGKMAADYLAKNFPEFSKRLKLLSVNERVSGTMNAHGAQSSWTSGYLVQFAVTSGGVPVSGNYVNLMIAADKVERVSFKVYGDPGAAPQGGGMQPVDLKTHLADAIPGIKHALGIQSKYALSGAELVYVNHSLAVGKAQDFNDDFVLAWHVLINPNYEPGMQISSHIFDVWLDASNGDLIGAQQK